MSPADGSRDGTRAGRARAGRDPADRSSGWPRLVAVLAIGLLPWTVVFTGGQATLVFAVGLVDPVGLTLTDVYSYTFLHTRWLPAYLFAWPLGVGLYVLALASAVLGTVTGREDRRVTAGIIVLVALTQFTTAWGFGTRPGYVALPIGPVVVAFVVWLVEWPAIRGSVLPTNRDSP